MFSPEIMLLGLALAIDAAVVTFAVGLLHVGLPVKSRLKRALMISFGFGFFQFAMMWLGSYGGYLFSFSHFGYLFRFIVGAIFLIISAKFFHESFNEEERKLDWGFFPIITLSLATSIDALAAGVGLGTLPRAYLASLEVGLITFSVCLSFYFLSQFFKQIPEKWLLRLGSFIFLILGGEILWGIFSKG